MEDALNLLMVKGDCSLATMPYDYSDNSAQPSQAALTEAMQYRIGSWSRIQQNSISDIKGFLANDSRPVILGIKVFSDFDNLDANNPVYNVAKGTSRGNHAIVLIGYDDAQQAFKFINCWGTGWGLGGYGWLAYSFVDTAAISGYVAVDATP
jgi:C1A family cysteine protease